MPDPADPFPELLLEWRWRRSHAEGAIHNPWGLMQQAIDDISHNRNIRGAVWMIQYVAKRLQ